MNRKPPTDSRQSTQPIQVADEADAANLHIPLYHRTPRIIDWEIVNLCLCAKSNAVRQTILTLPVQAKKERKNEGKERCSHGFEKIDGEKMARERLMEPGRIGSSKLCITTYWF